MSEDTPPNRARTWHRVLVSVLALATLPALLDLLEVGRIIATRIGYTYDLHWIDGGSLLHAHRLMNGQAVYPVPTENAGFLAHPYPPVLYLALAAAGAIFGLDYVVGRVIAVTATAVGAALLAREVYLRFRGLPVPWVWALMTLGGIAAGYAFTGAWYDATMSDPLALGLAIVTAKTLLTDSQELGKRRLVLVPVLMVATIFTKQTYAAFVMWQVLFLCRSNLRQGLLVGAAAAALGGLVLLFTQYATGGGFVQYVGTQMLSHPTDPRKIWAGIVVVLRFAPYLPLLVIGGALLAFKRAWSSPAILWTGMLVTAFPVALAPYAKAGGWDNVFMPIAVIGPAATSCVLADVARIIAPRKQALLLVVFALGGAVYLSLRRCPEAPYIADQTRKHAVARLNDFVATLQGDVLIPTRPFLAIRHGSRVEQIHVAGWFDALVAGRRRYSFDDFMRRTRPRYVILSDQEPAVIVEAMALDYFMRGRMPADTWPAQTLEMPDVNPDPARPAYPGQLQWLLERNEPDPEGSRSLFEFESSAYDGWTVKGEAFTKGPTPIETQRGKAIFAVEGTVLGVVGRSFASSYPPELKDAAVGKLESPPFVVDRDNLRLRVAGGASRRTRVALAVDGKVRHRVNGRGNNYLEEVEWKLAGYRGRTAQLIIIDDDKAGHVMVDHVRLVDVPPD